MGNDIQKIVQGLIDKHEAYKLKWMDLTVPDMFSWIELKESMKIQAIELKSQYIESKAQLEKDKAMRVLELKAEVDENWKKLTEKSIDSTLLLEFQERTQELNALSKYRDLLIEYAENVLEYVNVVKLNLKNDLPF